MLIVFDRQCNNNSFTKLWTVLTYYSMIKKNSYRELNKSWNVRAILQVRQTSPNHQIIKINVLLSIIIILAPSYNEPPMYSYSLIDSSVITSNRTCQSLALGEEKESLNRDIANRLVLFVCTPLTYVECCWYCRITTDSPIQCWFHLSRVNKINSTEFELLKAIIEWFCPEEEIYCLISYLMIRLEEW